MADWYLNPALTQFRVEVNSRWPDRDRASDGTIGDTAHQASRSDHNPDLDGSVDAWDMDVDGVDVAECISRFEAHEASKYWIYNDRICFRSENWQPRSYAYAGPNRNQHRQHVHFNTREGFENSTQPWGIDVTAKQNWTDPVIPMTESTARRIGGKEGDLRTGATLLQYAVIYGKDAGVDAKAARLAAEATLTAVRGDTDEQAILTRIDQVAQQLAKVPDEVADALADADRPAEDTAAALRVVLGDRAVEVGRILAGQA